MFDKITKNIFDFADSKTKCIENKQHNINNEIYVLRVYKLANSYTGIIYKGELWLGHATSRTLNEVRNKAYNLIYQDLGINPELT